MKPIDWKSYIGLMIFATIGLVVFSLLLDTFYPYKGANVRIGRAQAIEVAEDFMDERGYDLYGFKRSTVMQYDDEAFIYLQKKFGFKIAQDMLRYKPWNGYDFSWRVFWFENVPSTAPQERFAVLISGSGDIVGFHHDVPTDWPSSEDVHLDQDEALRMAGDFLEQRRVDSYDFRTDIFTSQVLERRTDYTFRWRKDSDFDESYVSLVVQVQGPEVGHFEFYYRPPENEATVIKQQSGNEYFFKQVIPTTVLFLIGLILFAVFLKKYHEGEIEVRTGGLVFLLMWVSFLVQAILKFRVQAFGVNLGELSIDGVALFIFIILILIVRPFLSIFGFIARSVGESLARER